MATAKKTKPNDRAVEALFRSKVLTKLDRMSNAIENLARHSADKKSSHQETVYQDALVQ